MSTLNVKIPDEMEEDIEAFLAENPHYLNKSELVRDALRHVLASSATGDRSNERIGIDPDDPFFSAPTFTVEDPPEEGEIDAVLYGETAE